MNNKNILITGARGFLGTHLMQKLTGNQIVVSHTELNNLFNIEALIKIDISFDYIFHLAAYTKAGDWCLYHKAEQWEHNQLLNTNMLYYWHHYQPQAKMICIGTSCAYDPLIENKLESTYLHGQPDKSLFTYGMTKRMLHIGLNSMNEQYGLKYINFVPSTLYGPRFHENDSHFVFDLIKKIVKGKLFGTPVTLWGDGSQIRQLVFIQDFINIMLKYLDIDNILINVGGSVTSIKYCAELICKIIGYDANKINYDTSAFVGVAKKVISSEYAPCIEYTTIEDGMEQTLDWYLSIIKKEKNHEKRI